jgi:hypothetical protein
VPSAPSIDERLASLEEADREISELRHVVATRLEDVRRGSGVFDAATRELVRRLRELEHASDAERRELEPLVEAALAAVLARRTELRVGPPTVVPPPEPLMAPDPAQTRSR